MITSDDHWLTQSPIAHRGLHDEFDGRPENSLEAFEAACRQGYPIELDVQLTKDHQVAVMHDSDLKNISGKATAPSEINASELKDVTLKRTGRSLSFLEEVLDLVAGRVPILVEVKNRGTSSYLERRVAKMLRPYSGAIAVESFNPLTLVYLRREGVERPLGQVSGRLEDVSAFRRVVGKSLALNLLTRPDFLSYQLEGLPAWPVKAWRRLGLPVIAWVVHSVAEEHRALENADNFIFSGYLPSRKSTLTPSGGAEGGG